MSGPNPFNPSAEQLAEAYAAHRRRSWPATLAAALACPLHSRLIHLHAKQRWLRGQHHTRPVPPARMQATPGRAPSLAPAWDGKRAAAGDRDD